MQSLVLLKKKLLFSQIVSMGKEAFWVEE